MKMEVEKYCAGDVLGLAAALYADMRLEQRDGVSVIRVYDGATHQFDVPLSAQYLSVNDAVDSTEFTIEFELKAEVFAREADV